MDAIPTPRPTKTRPTMRTVGLGAADMMMAPAKKSKSATNMDNFRPKRSFAHPPIAAPMIAPATAMLTMISCMPAIEHLKMRNGHLQNLS